MKEKTEWASELDGSNITNHVVGRYGNELFDERLAVLDYNRKDNAPHESLIEDWIEQPLWCQWATN